MIVLNCICPFIGVCVLGEFMRCISPLTVRVSGQLQVVPCGKCAFCLMAKRADWTFRINQEAKKAMTAFFLTFTYGNFFLPIRFVVNWCCLRVYPYEHSLVKSDWRLFKKRLRKAVYPCRLRDYSVGEYGELNGRPHYHSIMFNMPACILPKLERLWGFGFVNIGDVNLASIHYVTKYVMKPKGEYGGREPPFALMSRRPGIGSGYLGSHGDWHRVDMKSYSLVNGVKNRLPRYYREKLFSKAEREAFALEGISVSIAEYREAIEGLKKFHGDPEGYYYERLVTMYEAAVKSLTK